jgi:hypothetical protein
LAGTRYEWMLVRHSDSLTRPPLTNAAGNPESSGSARSR